MVFLTRARSALRLAILVAGGVCGLSAAAFAHPAPFSYLDLQVQPDGLRGTLVVHALDLSHDLGPGALEPWLTAAFVTAQRENVVALLRDRLRLVADGRTLEPEFESIEALPDRQAVRLGLRVAWPSTPGVLRVSGRLFPYDPNHQTFVNVYEGEAVTHQAIIDRDHAFVEYFTGTKQGALAVVKTFVASGIRHIAVGPDHVLFIIGLLLLGGGLPRLLGIVTAFTLGHSLTLSLAALDLLNPPARIVEPAIALSIVYVGADNMMVTRESRDVRPWIALFFGFVHGFGFAAVLKEFGLPRQALGWSLFSFNAGVEIGQACIVLVVASALAAVRSRDAALAQRIAMAGSVGVILAGAVWFVERVFFQV